MIFFSTVVDYLIGINIQNKESELIKKTLLIISIIFNLGLLCLFKYYNFFIESWFDLFNSFGYEIKSLWTLNIILPVGISFYTFQTMSYSIDIFNKKLEPTKDFIAFATFVSFFPQLVAGPIERATNLLPQILNKRIFKYVQAVQGLRLILWGLFKKVVIADSLAPMVNDIFLNYQDLGSMTLWLGAIYFSIQIYCDFSGYSDIAIGLSKILGFELMSNFKFPYLSRNIGEFWRRWHISLSTWFRDYVYIPLGGSRHSKIISVRNVFIIFLISGFWHGANWTYIIWGLFHAILFIPSFIKKNNRKFISSIVAENSLFPSLREFCAMVATFLLVTIGWVFFRSENIINAFEYLLGMFSDFNGDELFIYLQGIPYVLTLIILDFLLRHNERLETVILTKKLRWFVYSILLLVVLSYLLMSNSNNEFIYFQF